METLVVVAHDRNHHQYYGRNRGHGPAKFDSFGSSPSGNLPGINCRSFQSGAAGLLPTPSKVFSAPVAKNAVTSSLSPRTPSPHVNEIHKCSKRSAKSSTSPIPIKISFGNKEVESHFSERWAGPAYSNSPPPSSLPLPKFFMRPKRTVSLDLPTFASEIDLHPIAKSAPASPTRGRSSFPSDWFDSADSATRTLRRILNLDITDE